MDITYAIARIRGVSLKQKIFFTRNLSLIIKAGMSLPQGLETLALQTESPLLRLIITQIRDEVTQGKAFSEALGDYPHVFSPFYISMIKTGEASGTLEKVLKNLVDHMEKERALRSKILGALTYPAVIVTVMILVMIVMMVVAVPQLTSVFSQFNVTLPLMTRIVIAVSNFFVQYIILVIILVLVFPFALWYLVFRTKQGRLFFSWFALHTPLFATLTKKINSARLARTLETLITSGVPILTALGIISDVIQNHFYKQMLLKAAAGVEKGKPLNEILKAHPRLVPPVAAQLIAIGEETGSLDIVLENLAQFYEDEVDAATKNLSSIIEPLLMVIIGVAVGFFAVSMLQPIYTFTSSISY